MNVVASATVSAFFMCCLPLVAQETRTGISTPPATDNVQAPSNDPAMVQGYQPTPNTLEARHAFSSDASTTATAPVSAEHTKRVVPLPAVLKEDVDAGIVASVPHAANELPSGTIFKVRMHETLSTAATPVGTQFSAELVEAVEQNGRILLPSGTILEGRVTQVRGGHRIHGAAALHLDPRKLVLPDGSQHLIRAQVIDTDQSFATRIDSEGTIIRRDHIKGTLAAMSLTTGGAAAAGAVLGGGVGALVGAGVGAGISTAWWLKQDRQTVLPIDTAVMFSLNEPIVIGTDAR